MLCPRDGVALEKNEKIERHYCKICHGLFLEKETAIYNKILTHTTDTKLNSSQEVQCPSCTTVMKVFSYKKVNIDVCHSCFSVWLDAGENEVIQKKIESIENQKKEGEGGAILLAEGDASSSIIDGIFNAIFDIDIF